MQWLFVAGMALLRHWAQRHLCKPLVFGEPQPLEKERLVSTNLPDHTYSKTCNEPHCIHPHGRERLDISSHVGRCLHAAACCISMFLVRFFEIYSNLVLFDFIDAPSPSDEPDELDPAEKEAVVNNIVNNIDISEDFIISKIFSFHLIFLI